VSNLLYLETSSKNCSVGISRNGKLLALEELSEASFSHAEKLHPFINGVLEKAALSMTDLSGVVVGKGPGSYTGLRIGVAAAKGLCFALQIPLVGVGSLETLAEAVCSQTSAFIIPLIDARRMEVFTAVFDTRGKQIESPWAEVLESNSFSPYLDKNKCLFVGDGQEKFKKILNHPHAVFKAEILQPSVQQMVRLGTQKFEAKAFEDLAYFEPFYLKEFYTTPPKS
jgi:tRNA threonylcarbamoyladenosine biosynthesis protein TsaB